MKHLTDGELRAALDAELHSDHLETCPDCQARLAGLRTQSERVAQKLAFLAAERPAPATRPAWNKFKNRLNVQKENSMFKKWLAFPAVRFAAAFALVLTLILSFPQTRALANELLNLFRVQQVTVIPVDFTGLEQLTGNEALGSQLSDLISSSTTVTQEPAEPQEVADAAQASQLAGFTVRAPQGLTPSNISVTGSGAFTITVDRVKAQALLDEAGRNDLMLPASLDGAKISVNIPASVSIAFGTCPSPRSVENEKVEFQSPGRRYPDCIFFAQIPSPTVNAPADVDVAQLAQLGLEFTGMSAEQAAAYTSTVDWQSTLVIPIPKNAASYEQVSVDGVTGTLIQRPADDMPQYALVWVKDGIVYALSGLGTMPQQALDIANSLP